MERLLDALGQGLAALWKPRRRRPVTRRAFRCRCERPVFFRNTQCLACRAELGFEPERGQVRALQPARSGLWTIDGEPAGGLYRRCTNHALAAGCNWLVPMTDAEPLCLACRLNRTIPDLSVEADAAAWCAIEVAKRRLVSQLIALGLPIQPRDDAHPEGLEFDFLREQPSGPRVLTGHASGLITLNIEEADDAARERIRTAMGEPYRTLLGHLRHEVGHYYWDRLVQGSPWLHEFRKCFGDERADYAASLKRHYDFGPPPDWASRCVSAYAASHPWEDWAETWAHYLHMLDTLDTALSFGIDADDVEVGVEPFGPQSLDQPDAPGAAQFLTIVNAWVELTAVLNELSRSMGLRDFYPFVVVRPVVAKLFFVHRVVASGAG